MLFNFFTELIQRIGSKVKSNRIFMIPNFSAIIPIKDKHKATVPQQKPLINPAIILLYSGNVFCANTIVTGCASIVINPIMLNVNNEKIGILE